MLSILITFLATCTLYSQPSVINIGLIPGNGKEIEQNAIRFAKNLQEKVNIPINIYLPKDYQGLIDAMKNKQVDFAFFTAMSFVYAEKEAGAKVLLKSVWDRPYYFSTIVTLDKDIKSLKDLKGKRIGFVDEKSTSGYLLPLLELRKHDIKKEDLKIKYTGNHKKSIEMLLSGEVDAVAVFSNDKIGKTGAWDTYFPEKSIQIKSLWISKAIPTDPFTVRSDFYENNQDLTYEVMFNLLEMPSAKPNINILKDTLGVSRMVTANSSQYDPIRKMIADL